MTLSNEPEPTSTASPPGQCAPNYNTDDVGSVRKFAVGFMGVVLPLVALVVEFTWPMCRDMFLDPLPTPLHACLIAWVAVFNAALLLGAGRRFPWWGRLFSGVTLTTSTIYALVFLPIVPFGLIAVVVSGLGLLALSPLLSLIAGLLVRRLLGSVSVVRRPWLRYPSWFGVLVALVLFGIPAIRPLVTYGYVKKTMSADPATAASAIAAIRRSGAEQTLLETCLPAYGRQNGSPLTLSFLLQDLPKGTVAAAYYRATGRACKGLAESTSGPMGRSWHLVPTADDPEGPDDHDPDLKLASSRIDGTIDAPAALGYLEWTWVVHNNLAVPREGIAEIALPPGAVVSRATLWINDEPREAAFAERHQARSAYEKVVNRRRDPLLVMRTPQGTVQLKFFPIPGQGDLKLRIGITTPLRVISADRAALALPRILYRNFAPVDAHQLWVEAKTPFEYHSTEAQMNAGVYRLDRALPTRDLQQPGAHLDFRLAGLPTPRWASDSIQSGKTITQRLRPISQEPPKSVVLVVDSSRGQAEALKGIAAALASFPATIPITVIVAGDQPKTLLREASLDHNAATRLAQSLREVTVRGGADNAAVLTTALESSAPGAALLWVHGPQPVELSNLERLRQVLERSSSRPRIYELTTSSGQNRVTQALFESAPVESLEPSFGVEAELFRLFQSWAGSPQFGFERSLLSEGSELPTADAQTSDHLVRLWANETIELLANAHKVDDAVKLAAQYKLVTSVSGAVVLESAEQYADAKLSPPGPEQVPSVPEPATIVIVLLVAVALVGFATLQKSRTRRALT